jgi:F-type H+-transporting ATPase subunit delta
MAKEIHTTPLAVAYARSIRELATALNTAADIGRELTDLSKIVDDNDDLQNFLASPAIGEVERGRVLDSALRSRASELTLNALLVMNRKGRLGILLQVVNAYNDLLQMQQGIIEADVIVAEKLSTDQLEQVRQRVSSVLKREVVMHQYVDVSIIGGLVLRIEDRLLDASVKAQLRAIRRQLLAARPK